MQENPSSSERRRSERISQSFPVHAAKEQSESLTQEQITGLTRDISGSGLSFLSDKDYAAGDILSLQIDLPASQHQLRVKVVHVETLGDSKNVGVAFIDISPAHQKALMEELFEKK